jgi:ATP-binding cassette subfamily C protein/ATP-binding cassette subfamily C protein EexD
LAEARRPARRNGPSDTRASELTAALSSARGAIVIASAFGLFVTVLLLITPVYVFQILDRVVASRSVPTLTMLTVLAGGALMVLAVLDLVRRMVLLRAGAALERRLTGPVLDILFDTARQAPRPGLRQALADLGTLRAGLGGRAVLALTDVPWIPVFLALVPLFNHWLLVLAAMVLLLQLVPILLARPLTARRRRQLQSQALMADSELEERLRHAPTLAAMGMTGFVVRRWSRLNGARDQDAAVLAQRLAVLSVLAGLVRRLGTVGMLALAGWLYIENEVSSAAVITAGLLADRAFAVPEAVLAGWKEFVAARGARDRLTALFETSPPPRERMPLPPPKGAVALQQVMVAPPNERMPVLKSVSLDLPAGGSLGVIGPTGAGKSVLARTLVGLWTPVQGTVRLDGNDLRNWNDEQLGEHVGYLSQDIDLTDGTVAENIARMGPVDADRVIEAARRAGVHETVLRLGNGYDTPVGEGGHLLPAGLRQRIALARALFGDPRLVVLDEPNAFQDAEGEQALVRAIATMQADGRTVVMITQKPSLLSGMETVLVLRDGQVEMMGPRQSILARFTRGGGQGQPQPQPQGRLAAPPAPGVPPASGDPQDGAT